MKNHMQSFLKPVRNGSLILISYFFVAACIPQDEGVAPKKAQNDALVYKEESEGVGSLMKTTFVAHLQGDNEIPPIDTQAQGQAIFKLSKDGTSLEYKLIVANIEDVFAAHIHCGGPAENGDVLVNLFASGSGDVNGVIAEGVITQASMRGAASCPQITTFQHLLELLQTGGAYVNVHTTATGSGEIRGQIR